MALPIAPTPTLHGKEAERFLSMVEEGLAQPLRVATAPDLTRAKEKARRWFMRRDFEGTYE